MPGMYPNFTKLFVGDSMAFSGLEFRETALAAPPTSYSRFIFFKYNFYWIEQRVYSTNSFVQMATSSQEVRKRESPSPATAAEAIEPGKRTKPLPPPLKDVEEAKTLLSRLFSNSRTSFVHSSHRCCCVAASPLLRWGDRAIHYLIFGDSEEGWGCAAAATSQNNALLFSRSRSAGTPLYFCTWALTFCPNWSFFLHQKRLSKRESSWGGGARQLRGSSFVTCLMRYL